MGVLEKRLIDPTSAGVLYLWAVFRGFVSMGKMVCRKIGFCVEGWEG